MTYTRCQQPIKIAEWLKFGLSALRHYKLSKFKSLTYVAFLLKDNL